MKTDGSDVSEKGKTVKRSDRENFKSLINSEKVINSFREVIGEKAVSYLASVFTVWQQSVELQKCESMSILAAAMQAATYDLPIDSNLGFAAIVPCSTKIRNNKTKEERWVKLAQFQIMYKGYIQLALRSGQYKTINVSPIYEDEFESYDIITGDIAIKPVSEGYREQDIQEKITGYVAFFRLVNGFERLEYWSLSKLKAHGEKFSKSFDDANSLWKKDPHAMYAKTILKNTISKWGILSITMQNAIMTDQAVIKDFNKPLNGENVAYIDSLTAGISSEIEELETLEDKTEAQAEKTKKGTRKESKVFPKDEAEHLEELFAGGN